MLIREYLATDLPVVNMVINDSARAYRGVIPADCWHEPYMSHDELAAEIAAGVQFSLATEDDNVVAVMGTQKREDVALIRHAYVSTQWRRRGCGSALLAHARRSSTLPWLIGTWAAAHWAIAFYVRHGFVVVDDAEKTRLLQRYWQVPARQSETSVVLSEVRAKVS
jgi:N-acetylglutamate synthase-like GNAT family acetyltransferase